jgi:MoaA/NifB/PqqE/SkfB family radical SAM enzyme
MELTNRCNLNCQHCFSGRHGGKDDLSLRILRHVLASAQTCGFDEISFTGGEPTVYPHFVEALRLAYEGGYRFGFVSNGQNFPRMYPRLLPYREKLSVITFSLDGASEETHDRLRGRGTFRKLMQAISVCVVADLPFTLNMVVTAHNRHEVGEMAQLARGLGSRGLRFGHLMPNHITTAQGFDLSPWARKEVEAEIWHLRDTYSIPIAMAPGYHTTNLFPCGPLKVQELNIDCQGNLTRCCHLSSHGDGVGQGDVIGNLSEMSFTEAYQRLVQENEQFHQKKLAHLAGGRFRDSDFFPCWYCSLYYRKVDWLKEVEDHPWAELMRDRLTEVEEPSLTRHPVEFSSIYHEESAHADNNRQNHPSP